MLEKTPRTIWIIGAGSGIGRSLAISLSQKGHKLILSGRRDDKLQSLKDTHIPNASVYPLDVKMTDDVQTVFAKIAVEQGPIDSVIIMSAQYEPMTMDHIDVEKSHDIVQTNVSSAFSILSVVVPHMKSRQIGQIVFCGSVAGYKGLPNAQPYSATKAAIINLAESCRLELAPWGIDVKVINPGFVQTDMTAKNNFQMPFLMNVDDAGQRIAHQIFNPNLFEIKTHRLFTYVMKFIKLMPYWLYFKVFKKTS